MACEAVYLFILNWCQGLEFSIKKDAKKTIHSPIIRLTGDWISDDVSFGRRRATDVDLFFSCKVVKNT